MNRGCQAVVLQLQTIALDRVARESSVIDLLSAGDINTENSSILAEYSEGDSPLFLALTSARLRIPAWNRDQIRTDIQNGQIPLSAARVCAACEAFTTDPLRLDLLVHLRRACWYLVVLLQEATSVSGGGSPPLPNSLYSSLLASLLLVLVHRGPFCEGLCISDDGLSCAPPWRTVAVTLRLLILPSVCAALVGMQTNDCGEQVPTYKTSHHCLAAALEQVRNTLGSGNSQQRGSAGDPLRALWRGFLVCLEVGRLACIPPGGAAAQDNSDIIAQASLLRSLGAGREMDSCIWPRHDGHLAAEQIPVSHSPVAVSFSTHGRILLDAALSVLLSCITAMKMRRGRAQMLDVAVRIPASQQVPGSMYTSSIPPEGKVITVSVNAALEVAIDELCCAESALIQSGLSPPGAVNQSQEKGDKLLIPSLQTLLCAVLWRVTLSRGQLVVAEAAAERVAVGGEIKFRAASLSPHSWLTFLSAADNSCPPSESQAPEYGLARATACVLRRTLCEQAEAVVVVDPLSISEDEIAAITGIRVKPEAGLSARVPLLNALRTMVARMQSGKASAARAALKIELQAAYDAFRASMPKREEEREVGVEEDEDGDSGRASSAPTLPASRVSAPGPGYLRSQIRRGGSVLGAAMGVPGGALRMRMLAARGPGPRPLTVPGASTGTATASVSESVGPGSPASVARPSLDASGSTADTGLPTLSRMGSTPPMSLPVRLQGLEVATDMVAPQSRARSRLAEADNERDETGREHGGREHVRGNDEGRTPPSSSPHKFDSPLALPVCAPLRASDWPDEPVGLSRLHPPLPPLPNLPPAGLPLTAALRIAVPAQACGLSMVHVMDMATRVEGAEREALAAGMACRAGLPVHPLTGHILSPRHTRTLVSALQLLRAVCEARPGLLGRTLHPLPAYVPALEGLAGLGGVPCLEVAALSALKPMVRHLGAWKRAHTDLLTAIYKHVPSRATSVEDGEEDDDGWAETPSFITALLAMANKVGADGKDAVQEAGGGEGDQDEDTDDDDQEEEEDHEKTEVGQGSPQGDVEQKVGDARAPLSLPTPSIPCRPPGLPGASLRGTMASLAQWARTHPEETAGVRHAARASVPFPAPPAPAPPGGSPADEALPMGAVREPVRRSLTSSRHPFGHDARTAEAVEEALAARRLEWEAATYMTAPQ